MKPTIQCLFGKSAEKHSGHVAIIHKASDAWKEVTYSDLLARVEAFSAHLMDLGVKKGDRVAIVSENRPEWPAACMGALLAGAVAVPVDARLSAPEVKNIISDAEPRVVFMGSSTRDAVVEATADMPLTLLDFDSKRPDTAPGETYPIPDVEQEDVAALFYTSGTTGNPKAVMLTHYNLISDAKAIRDAGIITGGDNVMAMLPLHHTYPFMCTFLVPLFLGATITYPYSIKGPDLVATIRDRKVSIVVGVPQLLEVMRNSMVGKFRDKGAPISWIAGGLLRLSRSIRRGIDINLGKIIFRPVAKAFGTQFKYFTCGGARLDPLVMADLEALGFTVIEGYGLTETSPVVAFNPPERRKPGSVGRELDTAEVRILPPAPDAPPGTHGEIAISGPMVMKGYYKRPEETENVLKDGAFLSGDLGYKDPEGYVFITGRAKEVIVLSNGKTIYPEDIERHYAATPLIKEICAVENKGRLEAVIVPDTERAKKDGIGNIGEALKWKVNELSRGLPPHMRLMGYVLNPGPLPKTALGKVRRFMVGKMLVEGRAGEGRGPDESLLRDEVGRKVAEALTPLVEEKHVHGNDNLELDLGMDSLKRMELIVALEKSFNLKLPDGFASEVQTVRDIVDRLKSPTGMAASAETKTSILDEKPDEDKLRRIGLKKGGLEWAVSGFLMFFMRLFMKIYFRLSSSGAENLPAPPYIIAPNHNSYMDGFIVAAGVKTSVFKDLYFQGYEPYFRWWPNAIFARLAHVIPIDTEKHLSGALAVSAHVLREGRALCLFPEGGRSFDGGLMEFKKGIGMLALELGVPVVPAYIDGAFRAWPRHNLFPRPLKLKITFGKALLPSDFSADSGVADRHQLFADELRRRVGEMGKSK